MSTLNSSKLCVTIFIATIFIISHVTVVESVIPVGRLFRELIQGNLAGQPITHQIQEFEFDPEISLKRRQQYVDLHGFKAEKIIERVGLGIDGKNNERLAEQQQRDQGHLQGANYREVYSYLQGRNYNNFNNYNNVQ